MYVSDLLVSGKMTGTIQPALGIFNNLLLYDKYRGVSASAAAPIGTLDVAGSESTFVRALGVSPVYFEHTGGKHDGAPWPKDLYDKVRKYTQVVMYEKVEKTQFTVRPTTKDREWSMFRDSGYMYLMTPTTTYNRLLMEIQEDITNAYPSGGVKPVVVGMAMVKDGEIISRPRKQIKYGSHSMSIDIPQSDIKVGIAREYALYNGLLAYAIRQLVKDVDSMTKSEVKSPEPSEEEEMHGYYNAWATYLVSAYAGANKTPPEGQIYTATDLYDYTLPYLGLPFSLAYPYLTYPEGESEEALTKAARLQTSILALNVILSIVGARVGGKTLPVQYLKERGSIRTAEEVLKYYLRMPIDMGGSNAIWMQPCFNVPVADAIMVPYPIGEGETEWQINTQWPTTYKDVTIDRGEIPMVESEGPGVDTLRLIATRDSRVIIVRKFDNEFLLLKIPAMERKGMISNGLSYLLSYVSDPTLAMKGGIPVNRRYTQGKSVIGMVDNVRGVFEFKMEGRDARGNRIVKTKSAALPGGVNDGELEKDRVVKDVPTPRTGEEVKKDVPEVPEEGVFKGAKENVNLAHEGEDNGGSA